MRTGVLEKNCVHDVSKNRGIRNSFKTLLMLLGCCSQLTYANPFSQFGYFKSKDPFYRITSYQGNYMIPRHYIWAWNEDGDPIKLTPGPGTIKKTNRQAIHLKNRGSLITYIPAERGGKQSRFSYIESDGKMREETVDPEKQLTAEQSEAMNEKLEEILNELVQHNMKNYQPVELAFQISLKIPLFRIPKADTRFYAAYTQYFWWQAYTGESAFMRTINFTPEIFVEQPLSLKLGELNIEKLKIGLVHQSAGKMVWAQCSWNRICAEIFLRWKFIRAVLQPWYVLPTKDYKNYNEDMLKYFGHGQLSVSFHHKGCCLATQFRKGTLPSKGSVKATLSVPVSPSLAIFVYGFRGYGADLCTYKVEGGCFGIGLGTRF